MNQYSKESYRFRIMNYIFYCGVIPSRIVKLIGNDAESVVKRVRYMKKEGWVKQDVLGEIKMLRLANSISFYDAYEDFFFCNYENWYSKIRNRYIRTEENTENMQKMQRLTQLAESSIFLAEAGVKIFPDDKESLSNSSIEWKEPTFYQSLEIKQLMAEEEARATYSRAAGYICDRENVSPVYSLNEELIKVSEISEKLHLERLLNFWNGRNVKANMENAVLFAWKYKKIHAKLSITKKYGSLFTLNDAYKSYYLIPYSSEGKRLVKLLYSPYAKEELMNMLIRKSWKLENSIDIEADGIDDNGVYLFNYLIPDIYRLKKFIRAAKLLKEKKFHIFCYDFQKDAVIKEIEDNITVSSYSLDTVEEIYKKRVGRRENFG